MLNSDRSLDTIKELRAYLFTAVKNQSIRAISKDPLNFESFNYNQATRAIESVNPEDLMIGIELESFIAEVISSLPDQCQLVFRKVREENMTNKEVAEELQISPETVKKHLSKALKKIRIRLEAYFANS